jgi:lectin, mannose-binding 2
VTAKARLTYFKGKFTEVGPFRSSSTHSALTLRLTQLAIHHDKWDEWTTCFTFEGLELPSNPFLGFSAHTGDVHGTSTLALRTSADELTSLFPPIKIITTSSQSQHRMVSVTQELSRFSC